MAVHGVLEPFYEQVALESSFRHVFISMETGRGMGLMRTYKDDGNLGSHDCGPVEVEQLYVQVSVFTGQLKD